MKKASSDMFSEAETIERRESALKRMLNTPHQSHKATGKDRKPKKAKSQGPKETKSA